MLKINPDGAKLFDIIKKFLFLKIKILTDKNAKTENINFQERNRNQEAIRLSDGLLIELRRTTTIVKQ